MSARRNTGRDRRFGGSVPFTPAALANGALWAWYRSDAGVSTSGANITTVADQSPNGLDLTAGAAAPTLVTDVGRPAFRMDGTSAQYVRRAAPAGCATAYTVWAVIKIDTVAVVSNYLFGVFRTSGVALGAASGNRIVRHGGFVNISVGAVDTANYQLFVFTGGDASPFTPTCRVNGVTQTNSPVGNQSYGAASSATDFISIGFDAASTKGFIRECGWYNRRITASEWAALEAYANGRWSVY